MAIYRVTSGKIGMMNIARSSHAAHPWAIVSAGLAPILLTGSYLIAGILAFAARSTSPWPRILGACGSAAVTAVFLALLGWLLAETRARTTLNGEQTGDRPPAVRWAIRPTLTRPMGPPGPCSWVQARRRLGPVLRHVGGAANRRGQTCPG